MSFLALLSFSFLCIGTPCMCGMLARCVCTACKCDCILLPALLPIEKSNRKLEPPGRIFLFPQPAVCVPKPNSLTFRGVVRKPGRPLGLIPLFPRPAVCVPKPNSLAFRGVVRKPGRPPGRLSHFPRAPHPNNEGTEGARLRFLFFPIIPGCGRMLPAGRSELPCTRHRSRCRCSPLPLHWHRS